VGSLPPALRSGADNYVVSRYIDNPLLVSRWAEKGGGTMTGAGASNCVMVLVTYLGGSGAHQGTLPLPTLPLPIGKTTEAVLN
jgi:hypothetical protein